MRSVGALPVRTPMLRRTAPRQAVTAAQNAVDAVADALKNAVNALIEGLRAGLNSIINAFQAGIQLGLALLQAALTGDWSGLALKILESVLRLVGVSPEDFYAFIGRATETIQIIIDDPGAFVGHLSDAFLNGVRQFGTNFLVHLQTERGVSPHTLRAYRKDLEVFTTYCAEAPEQVDLLDMRGFVSDQLATKKKGATVARAVAAVQILLQVPPP